jgi:UDP-N-acetylmuramoylalanine--D-glutamate ligase
MSKGKMNIEGKKVLILGAGESGSGAAVLAKIKGAEVFVSDAGLIKDSYKSLLTQYDIPFEEQGHQNLNFMKEADLVIKSPGIPEKATIMQELVAIEKRIVDEIEFAWHFTNGKCIAITGSNGKTTTTRLVYHILKEAGFDVGLAGNIGSSFALQVALADRDYYALEVSSFQLDRCFQFSPEIAIITNITADHLDRYQYQMDYYISSKLRIAQCLDQQHFLIFNADDENIRRGFDLNSNERSYHRLGISMAALADTKSGLLRVQDSNFEMPLDQLSIQGWHNRFNISCAVKAAQILGISNEKISHSLTSFINESHRLEWVKSVDGVDYINDSKATNVDAVFYALEAMTKKVVWIVGGVDKGNDYRQIENLVQNKVQTIICLGIDNKPLIDFFGNMGIPMIDCSSMVEAIRQARLYAKPGEVVLLSPACASFDLFQNYQHRGDQFKQIVKAMEAC